MTEALVLAAVVAVVAGASRWWRARQGRLREVTDRFDADELAALDVPPGARAIVSFTAPACRDCRSAQDVVEETTADRDVAVRTVDVGSSLELARAHRVRRAPTVFLVEADGAVARRVSGVPDPQALTRALDRGDDRSERAA